MNLQIRLVAIADNGPEQVHEIVSLQRTELQLETLGLTLAEGQTILREIQRVLVERQVAECLEPHPPVAGGTTAGLWRCSAATAQP